MRTRMTRVRLFLDLLAGVAPPAVAQVDQQRAQEFFKEVQALCERDGGRLWGVSLCAPIVIADRRTQTVATSQPAPRRTSDELGHSRRVFACISRGFAAYHERLIGVMQSGESPNRSLRRKLDASKP